MGKRRIKFTPKGLSVSARTRRISSRKRGAGQNCACRIPRPPALLTAATRSGPVRSGPIGAAMIGCSMPNIRQSGVFMKLFQEPAHGRWVGGLRRERSQAVCAPRAPDESSRANSGRSSERRQAFGPTRRSLRCSVSIPLSPSARAANAARHVVVYREAGRFAGWPANHGIWSWGNEILVGFSRGTYKDRGPHHHIDHDQPEEFPLARSLDGGVTWSVERPGPPGALAGTPGMRHGRPRRVVPRERPRRPPRADRLRAPRLRDDPPHGECEQRDVALLCLV